MNPCLSLGGCCWGFNALAWEFPLYPLFLVETILRVPDQNGVSLLYIMLEIHHSGQEPLKNFEIPIDEKYDLLF